MTGSALPVMLCGIASERKRWLRRRLVVPNLTGMRVLRKERFNMLLFAITVSVEVAWLLLKCLECVEDE